MRTSPEGVEAGHKLSQEEIEEIFDTGFGYRISGINPRRDDRDRRYILLFANENGPYSDSVTQGRFEYIGEGLKGDQSEESPGNSALIDARTSSIPIHFFYKRGDGEDWEYQGFVDVIDYEFREQDGRKVLVFTLEHQHQSETTEDTMQNGAPQLEERPDSGETFTAEVDRISSSGNGIIETKEGHINIGPVTPDAVGSEITGKMDSGAFARCMTEDVRVHNYETQYGLLKTPSKQSPASNPLPPTDNPLPPIDERTTTQIGKSTFCDQCASIMYPDGNNSRVCSSCGYEESYTTTDEGSETGSDNADGSSEKRSGDVASEEAGSTSPTESSRSTSSAKAETSYSNSESSTDTDELRKQAVESAVEEVPEEASTVQHETPTYNRSQAVKEYVKARAGGVCEGCGEPAPFTSKTGEPYLHAHHIHELSDGGSDTPDTVVALCPNCHYRVHHGEDGDEYNQELLEIVEEKENSK